MRGVVTRLLLGKGYGFVRGDDGQERFMFCRDVLDNGFDHLRVGIEVEFDSAEQPAKRRQGNGLRAVNVRPVTRDKAHA